MPSWYLAGNERMMGPGPASVVGGGGGGASAWGDHGSFLDLSTTTVTNDTVTSHDTSGYAGVRGTQARGSVAGKFYFELKLLTAPAANAINLGLNDANLPSGGMNTSTITHYMFTDFNNGNTFSDISGATAVNLGAGVTLANNDVIGVAFDVTNGFHYLALNNTWLLSGVPTSGASGTGHVGVYTVLEDFYPLVELWGVVNGLVQIVTGTGAFTYSPPSGYSAWG